jgi:uncharacterized Fe-S cluster protein YjdI
MTEINVTYIQQNELPTNRMLERRKIYVDMVTEICLHDSKHGRGYPSVCSLETTEWILIQFGINIVNKSVGRI